MSYPPRGYDSAVADSEWMDDVAELLNERSRRNKQPSPLRGYCWNCDAPASANLAVVSTATRNDGESRRVFYAVCSMRCHGEFKVKIGTVG